MTADRGSGEGDRVVLAEDMVVGPWRLVTRIGRGGFGEVWQARRLPDSGEQALGGAAERADACVALKIPTHRAYIRHLRREGAILEDLVHPGIVRVLGCDPACEPPWLAMELVSGHSLRDAIVRPGLLTRPMPPRSTRLKELRRSRLDIRDARWFVVTIAGGGSPLAHRSACGLSPTT